MIRTHLGGGAPRSQPRRLSSRRCTMSRTLRTPPRSYANPLAARRRQAPERVSVCTGGEPCHRRPADGACATARTVTAGAKTGPWLSRRPAAAGSSEPSELRIPYDPVTGSLPVRDEAWCRRRGAEWPSPSGRRSVGHAGRAAAWIAAFPAKKIDSSRMQAPGPGAWIIMASPA
ncbi:hypothetical protein GCM10022206_29310 [Streptomyces chiangmaiensis]